MVTKIKSAYVSLGQKLGALLHAPTRAQAQVMLFLIGVGLLSAGIAQEATAAVAGAGGLRTTYNDKRLAESVNVVLTYIEGSFGAMVMVAAGLAAIISSALGQYKAALGLLIVAVGAFILRSLVSTFFNDISIQQ